MRIGILQTGHLPDALAQEVGDYPPMFERLLAGHGFTFPVWDVEAGVLPGHPSEADGWLITGSRRGAYEPHAWIPPLEEFIRDIRDDGRPLVGICFGHQIIAQALGGRVEKSDKGWGLGRTIYPFPDGDKALIAWHQDQVTKLPEGAKVISSTDFCPYAALSYGDQIYSVQPHPEFDDAVATGLLHHRGVHLPEDRKANVTAELGKPLDQGALANQIATFFLTSKVPA